MTPDFAGLVVGQIGLYQLSFTAPTDMTPPPPLCLADTETNATLTIFRFGSTDGVGFCVAER